MHYFEFETVLKFYNLVVFPCHTHFLFVNISNHLKLYDKWDKFNFAIVNFLFLDGVVPRSLSCGVYISQLILFSRVCSNVSDTFLQQGLRESVFYGDLVYKFKRIVEIPYLCDQIKKIIKRYKKLDIT